MTCYLPYPLYLILQAFSGTVPGACFSRSDSPQPDPFPSTASAEQPLTAPCSAVSSVLWVCPTSHVRSSLSCPLKVHSTALSIRADVGSPGSRAKSFQTCAGSPTTRGQYASRLGEAHHVAFRATQSRRHPVLCHLSRLNTWPVFSPVNASPIPLRVSTHDSGPMRLAKPSSYGTFIHCFLPVSRRFWVCGKKKFTPVLWIASSRARSPACAAPLQWPG